MIDEFEQILCFYYKATLECSTKSAALKCGLNEADPHPQKVIRDTSEASPGISAVSNTNSEILNWGHFILILWWWGKWFYTESSCWLRVIRVFHVQLL